VPGEHGYQERNKRLREGIFIEEDTWKQIQTVATKYGLAV